MMTMNPTNLNGNYETQWRHSQGQSSEVMRETSKGPFPAKRNARIASKQLALNYMQDFACVARVAFGWKPRLSTCQHSMDLMRNYTHQAGINLTYVLTVLGGGY